MFFSGLGKKRKENTPDEELLLRSAMGDDYHVNRLLKAGACVEARNERRRTPLLCAAVEPYRSTMQILLAAGANVNAVDIDGNTPLLLALQRGVRGQSAVMLLAAGAKVNVSNKKGETPLHIAVGHIRDKSIVETMLFVEGADIHAKDSFQRTALHAVVRRQEVEYIPNIAELLIDAGIDVYAQDKDGHTALWYAETKGKTEIADLLRREMANLLKMRN